MPDSGSCVPADPHGPASWLASSMRQRSFEQMQLQPGLRVLDLGCGTGADTLVLAAVVGAGGEVHGVDYDSTMVAQARQRASHDNMAAWVSCHHANAAALPWPDGYFNASRSDRIFQQMLHPEHAFDEMLRVTQPGGRVVVIDGDWATLSLGSDETDMSHRLAYFERSFNVGRPTVGNCLHRLFSSRELTDIHVCVQSIFAADSGLARRKQTLDAARCWQQSLMPAAAASGLLASANVVLISGSKALRSSRSF